MSINNMCDLIGAIYCDLIGATTRVVVCTSALYINTSIHPMRLSIYGRLWDRSYYIKLIPYVVMADYRIDHTILSLYHMWLWQTIG